MNAAHQRASLLITDLWAVISGALVVTSRVDQVEQWLRITATFVAILAGLSSLYRHLRHTPRR